MPKKNVIEFRDKATTTKQKLSQELDELFQLPLAEFTNARNEIATRLKKSGNANEAQVVKSLAKPSVSAWAVNQLYWNYRKEFDQLIDAGQRVRKFQTSGFAGKIGEMRNAMDTRTGVLNRMSEIAAALLTEAGNSPTPDMLRRITTTLEALSSFASLEDGPTLGRMTQDVDPPGFDALTGFSFGSAVTQRAQSKPAKMSEPVTPKPSRADLDEQKQRKLEEARQAMLAASKVSLQSAKRLLVEAQAKAKKLEAEEKKAHAEANEAQKRRKEAETLLKKLSAAADDASERAQAIADEAEEAAKAVEDAKKKVDKNSRELEVLLGIQ